MNDTREQRRSDAIRVAVTVIGIVISLFLLWVARTLVLTVFLGILFALAVSAGADRLQRWKIPRGIAAPLIVFTVVGSLAAFGSWIGPTVREQTTELRIKLPEAFEKLEKWVLARGGGVIATITGLADDVAPGAPDAAARRDSSTLAGADTGAAGTLDSARRVTTPAVPTGGMPNTLRDRLLAQLGGAGRYLLHLLGSTLEVLTGIVLVIFLSIYLAVDPSVYRRGILHLVPRSSRGRADEVLTAIAVTLRKWLVTQLVAMVVIGTVTTVVLMSLKVRAAVPLGILAGLLEFVPTIGPILSSLPAIAMGFVDSPEKALFVTIGYVGIQFLENHLLIPILMKEGVNLPPALTIIMQALMAIVFGILGLFVAVPLLCAIVIAVKLLTNNDGPSEVAPATKV